MGFYLGHLGNNYKDLETQIYYISLLYIFSSLDLYSQEPCVFSGI